ncbi:MAG: hypothetical protein JSV41_02985 [Gemmatimonadota bacterium]|nr:MAG: hypothetical protein JSV41_02985 [Gemmatimonadota bacterium]
MDALPLDELLALVGRLDDAPGDDTPRERFRRFLRERVTGLNLLRRYIGDCAGKSDEQHVRALQDLVVHLGRLLAFEVEFGPYRGLPGMIGHSGLWRSPSGLRVVLELKTSETYTSQRPSLTHAIEELISTGEILGWPEVVGLYVVGHPDVPLSHLEKTILEEKQAHALRIVSIDSLLRLAQAARHRALTHQQLHTILRAGTPSLDGLSELVCCLTERGLAPWGCATEIGDAIESILDWLAQLLGVENEGHPCQRPGSK